MPGCKKRKLGPKTVDCVFLRCAQHSAAYKFLIIKSEIPDVHVNTITESRDATFFANVSPMKDRAATSSLVPDSFTPEPMANFETFTPSEQNNEEDDSIDVPRRSKKQRIPISFGDDFVVYLVDGVPKTLSEALASLDAENWKEAVHNEMDSILTNGTWEICDCPVGCKPVGCKWIFKKNSNQMVQLISIRLDLWPRVLPKRKVKSFLILILLLLD